MLLTEEQRLIQQSAKALADKVIRPHVENWEKNKLFPVDALHALSHAGFMGMLVPQAFGGVDVDHVTYTLVIAEIGINHNGSLKVAKEMADAAKKAGAEVVKHQTHIVEDEMSLEAKKVIPAML